MGEETGRLSSLAHSDTDHNPDVRGNPDGPAPTVTYPLLPKYAACPESVLAARVVAVPSTASNADPALPRFVVSSKL